MRLFFMAIHSLLQEVETPALRDGLGTALHCQFAADMQNMLLDRVDAEYQLRGDLAIGSAIHEQPQHLPLAYGQRLHKWSGSRSGRVKIGCSQLTRCL